MKKATIYLAAALFSVTIYAQSDSITLIKDGKYNFYSNDTIEYDTLPCNTISIKERLNDSLYIWKFTKNNISLIFDTLNYNTLPLTFEFLWATDKMLALGSHCGTYCWSNLVITFQNSPTIDTFQYIAIDTTSMNILELNDDIFLITNLITKDTISVETDFYKYRPEGGYPLFYIEIINFTNSLIEYKIERNNDNYIIRNIQYEFPYNAEIQCFHQW
ncbi:MAG: hypothetical protein LBO06_06390 [Bacteroidales bacterium]|jgi:hypothetical protein|nr:hypothetical protein [Bacteroidales bacterium]